YALADLLEHRSDVGAERWLRAAAEQGHREAAYRLARALERKAVEDPHEAFGLGRSPVRTGTGLRLTTVAPAPPAGGGEGRSALDGD
ncbi:sel1 repeat family protein, partial [Streptomyces sp. SID8016]|nr:sel1 repeat family protein [Streptomyces sp. SID8016]